MKDEIEFKEKGIDTYHAYIETEMVCMSQEMDELKAAATILLIKLNLGKQSLRDGKLLHEIINRRPLSANAEKLIKEWY